jgi:Single-strand binding protein family
MTLGTASAVPTKEFFVRTLIRDISLDDCVLDLVDNSIDSARELCLYFRPPDVRADEGERGSEICQFGLATNRSWKTDAGAIKEEVEYHRIVAWDKLATLCKTFLTKGRKIYVEGRIATRSYTDKSGADKSVTEIVIEDMILLDNRQAESAPRK